MKVFKVLGTGCAKCVSTEQRLQQVAVRIGIEVGVEKVQDPRQIMAYGVMTTPAIVLDEKLVHQGGIPTVGQIEAWIKE
ncbi:thioredoxin family protein [Marinomonas transparens]|uniref:Thioredoxin family protein n=1 Tax=Marinomonas transparens TaxID=2795388 RepID=A0A934N2D9_9GAMM|nr:thioredoxin family protein [Marinomonas transparens]MBJ7538657.1 thioredoxin family protein [Marinomonas transparens]